MKNNLFSIVATGIFLFSVLSPSFVHAESNKTSSVHSVCGAHGTKQSIPFFPLPKDPMNPVGFFISGDKSIIQFKTLLDKKSLPALFVWRNSGYLSIPYTVCGKEIIFDRQIVQDKVVLMFRQKGRTNLIEVIPSSGALAFAAMPDLTGINQPGLRTTKEITSIFCPIGDLTDIVVRGRVLKVLASDHGSFDISNIYLPFKGETHVVIKPNVSINPLLKFRTSFQSDLILSVLKAEYPLLGVLCQEGDECLSTHCVI